MSEIKSKVFSTGAVLTVIGGRLLCGMSEVYEILNFLTGDEIYTHQIPRAFDWAKERLLKQFPGLRDIDFSNVGSENHKEFLSDLEDKHGVEMVVHAIENSDWNSINPIEELKQMMPDKPVIKVAADHMIAATVDDGEEQNDQ